MELRKARGLYCLINLVGITCSRSAFASLVKAPGTLSTGVPEFTNVTISTSPTPDRIIKRGQVSFKMVSCVKCVDSCAMLTSTRQKTTSNQQTGPSVSNTANTPSSSSPPPSRPSQQSRKISSPPCASAIPMVSYSPPHQTNQSQSLKA